jgi:hypothetical protein
LGSTSDGVAIRSWPRNESMVGLLRQSRRRAGLALGRTSAEV